MAVREEGDEHALQHLFLADNDALDFEHRRLERGACLRDPANWSCSWSSTNGPLGETRWDALGAWAMAAKTTVKPVQLAYHYGRVG
jgi:hypothetical protein